MNNGNDIRHGIYRPDIDGLRAISVLAVLAFHAGMPFMPGGFIGVDVFFVISGYLITGLLLDEFRRSGDISFRGFWARRVRRLAPALLFVLATVLLSSIFLLQRISGETGALARAAIATLLLNANHFFISEAGDYFGLAAETNPLLHMWSLSVEEQFYIVWPLLFLFLLPRINQARLMGLLLAAFAVSFLASIYWSTHEIAEGFYLMPSRAWELLAGSLLIVYMESSAAGLHRWQSGIVGFVGLSLIVGTAMSLNGASYFPGPLAIFPVAGTVLFLIAGSASPLNIINRTIGTRPVVYVGKISYPLYLWHWPILVFSRSQRLYEPSPWRDGLALLISFVLAVLTYELIERRAWRRLKKTKPSAILSYGAGVTSVVMCMALVLGGWARYGWGYSDQERLLDASRKDMAHTGCMFADAYPRGAAFDACYPESDKASVLLWGDSHANQWNPALQFVADELGVNLATLTMNGCRPLPGPVGGPKCLDFNLDVIRNIARWRKQRHLTGIVLAARWPEGTGTVSPSVRESADAGQAKFYDWRASTQAELLSHFYFSLNSLAKMANEQGIRVLIVLPSPVQRFSAAHCLALKTERECFVSVEQMRAYAMPAENTIRRVAKENGNVRVMDPKDFLCGDGRCPVVLDGLIAYTDDDHISKTFSHKSAMEFSVDIAWLVSKAPAALDARVR